MPLIDCENCVPVASVECRVVSDEGEDGGQMTEAKSFEPAEIFSEISACPPLMRTQTKAVYIGREVDWTLTFTDGYEDRPGCARVMFHYQPHEVKFIAMGVPLADYPWLRSAHP